MDSGHAIPIIPKLTPKCNSPTPQFTEDGLILPRKLMNPFSDSKEKKDLQRELLFNQKIGKNVLDTKSELEKVMAKRAKDARAKEKEAEEKGKNNSLERKSSFEKKLAEQAAKLAKSTINDDDDKDADAEGRRRYDNLPEGQAEFLKIHAKMKSHCSALVKEQNKSVNDGVAKDDKDQDKITAGQENKATNNNNPKGL